MILRLEIFNSSVNSLVFNESNFDMFFFDKYRINIFKISEKIS